MKISALLLAVVAVAAANASAQTGQIRGTVTDRATGQPIEGVGVVAKGTSYGIQTKSNGIYVILGVPPGTYTLIAKRSGYAPVEIAGVVVTVNVERQLDIQMRADTGSATTVITNETIATRASTGSTRARDLAESYARVPAGDDAFSRCLIPPELIMRSQREIDLTDAQRLGLSAETAAAQAKFTQSQWALSNESRKLETLLAAGGDERATLAQLDRILTLEQEIKRAQLAMLIHVKSILTARQQEMINAIRWPDGRPRAADGSVLAPCGAQKGGSEREGA